MPLRENIEITATDNVDKNVIVKLKSEKIDAFPVCINGAIMMKTSTYEVQDKCDNKTSFLLYTLVKDTIAPILKGVPKNIKISDVQPVPGVAKVTAEDRCDPNITVIFEEEKTDTLITRTWKAADKCGNLAIDKQLIQIKKTKITPDIIVVEMYEGETKYVDISADDLKTPMSRTAVLKQDFTDPTVDFQLDTFNNKTISIFAHHIGTEAITYGRYDKVNTCDTLHVIAIVKQRNVIEVGEDLEIYNVFSPNDDNVNETFTIKGLEKYPMSSVSIYNRWGNIVYKSADYKNDWDGMNNNRPLPDGTYFYLLKVPNRKILSGYLQIMR